MSSSWTDIYKSGNDTDPEVLNLFRQFHCADCLKLFQQTNKEQTERIKMNTPPVPLQPLADDALNGLYHYFGQGTTNQISTLRLMPVNSNTTNNNNNNQSQNNLNISNTSDNSYHFDLQEKKLCKFL